MGFPAHQILLYSDTVHLHLLLRSPMASMQMYVVSSK